MWETIFPHLEFCRPKPNKIYFLCDILKVVDLDIFLCKIYSYWTSLVSFLESVLITSKLGTPNTNIQWSASTNLVRSAPVVIMADQNSDFGTEDPDLWFLHAESKFQNTQVTQSRTKFEYVVQKLPQAIMVSVCSLIMTSASSSATPYEDHKAKFFIIHTLLLAGKELRKLSIILHWETVVQPPWWTLWLHFSLKMRSPVVFSLFLERLPVEMRDHLVAKDFKNPSETRAENFRMKYPIVRSFCFSGV